MRLVLAFGWARRGLAVAVSLALSAGPAAAAGFNTFGTYQTTLEHTGSRVGIPAPDAGQFVPGDEWVVHRAAVQSGFNSAAGLIQSGLIRQGGGLGLDGCGTGNGLTYRYLEIKEYGSPIYNCDIFYGLGNVPSGQTITFDIFRRARDLDVGAVDQRRGPRDLQSEVQHRRHPSRR